VHDVEHVDFDRALSDSYMDVVSVDGQTQASRLVENSRPYRFRR